MAFLDGIHDLEEAGTDSGMDGFARRRIIIDMKSNDQVEAVHEMLNWFPCAFSIHIAQPMDEVFRGGQVIVIRAFRVSNGANNIIFFR